MNLCGLGELTEDQAHLDPQRKVISPVVIDVQKGAAPPRRSAFEDCSMPDPCLSVDL